MPSSCIDKFIYAVMVLLLSMLMVLCTDPALSMVSEITPVFSVSQNFTDNYDKSEFDTQEEWYTTYDIDVLMSFVGKRARTYINYVPQYKDYDRHDENDTIEHNVSLFGDFDPSRHSNIEYEFVYDDYDGDNNRESRESVAHAGGTFELGEHTGLYVSETYSRAFNRIQSSGEFQKHDTNDASIGLSHQFGERNKWSAGFDYSFDKFDDPSADEYESYGPHASLAYWFNVKYGFDTSASYDRTEFDQSENDEDTWAGHIRFIRRVTRHFQVYIKYDHTYSQDDTREHSVYNPSAGFDWKVSDTSNISAGAGVLFNEYEDQDGSRDVFFDIDAFKLFDFSERGSFAISAASGYEETRRELASLGFSTYYQAGFNYNYALTKRSSMDITGSYKRDEFEEEQSDRIDNTYDLSAGFNWSPLRWMNLYLSYSYINFETDDSTVEDYEENKAMVTVSFRPWKPIRLKPDYSAEQSRESIENKIFR